MESEFLGLGIRDTAVGIWNPTTIGIRNPSFTEKDLESSNWNPESMAWNPEFKNVLDSLYMGRNNVNLPYWNAGKAPNISKSAKGTKGRLTSR